MDNVLRLTGLARKAGRLAVGEEPVGEAARSRTAKLILVAADAAENTLRRAQRFAANGDAPILPVPFTKAELGGAVGRPTCAMLAFTDVGLASAAADSAVSLRQIEARQQSPDHPILWNVPETDYLKFYIFQVV